MAYVSFAPISSVSLPVTPTSARVAVPGGGSSVMIVTNLSQSVIFIVAGDSTVVASPSTGLPLVPYGQIALTIGASTYIAGIALSGGGSVNITGGS